MVVEFNYWTLMIMSVPQHRIRREDRVMIRATSGVITVQVVILISAVVCDNARLF